VPHPAQGLGWPAQPTATIGRVAHAKPISGARPSVVIACSPERRHGRRQLAGMSEVLGASHTTLRGRELTRMAVRRVDGRDDSERRAPQW
jgi:hypothetical protein